MSVHVELRTYRLARSVVGEKRQEREIDPGATVETVLDDLRDEYGLDPSKAIVILNGTNIKQLDGLSTPVGDGDSISISIGSMPE